MDLLFDDIKASISLFLVKFHLEQFFAFLVYSPYDIASQIRRSAKFLGRSGQTKLNWDGIEIISGDHRTCTMFFSLVVCMHMQSFKWFHSTILKIYTIFQYVKMLCKTCDVIDHFIWISHKCKYLTNSVKYGKVVNWYSLLF